MDIQIDTTAIGSLLEAMKNQIGWMKAVGIGQFTDDWQTDDMNRQKPFTLRARRAGYALATVHPHSLYETLKAAGYRAGATKEGRRYKRAATKQLKAQLRRKALMVSRRRKKKKKVVVRRGPWSTRPILRQELQGLLIERGNEFVRTNLNWAMAKQWSQAG